MGQTDEELFTRELLAWAESVPDTQRILSVEPRTRVRVCGMVRRLTIRPIEGKPSLGAVIADGTGEVTGIWTGTDQIRGLRLGTRLALEGMATRERDGSLRMVNPSYEFL